MKIEVARQDDRMAPSGAAILRSLQNESLPTIDLIVRESFQNALDAKLNNEKYVSISINTNKINTSAVSNYFDGISQNLENTLPRTTTVLSIADKNTTGLTGDFKTNDAKLLDQSNIYKLIYGINMNQEKGDAGGSWGLGKTSFFRIGVGIVVYYTRIKDKNGDYEERLAACLIEDSKDHDAIMPNNPRGIAWWGEKDSDGDEYEKTYPITDPKFIHRLLRDFHLSPYKDNETGTMIIIPFIQEEKIIINKDEGAHSEDFFWWEASMTDSLEMAIKRWYFPRLMNNNYTKIFKQPCLFCRINSKIVDISPSDKTFYIFSDLYNAALTKKYNDRRISVKEIYLKQLGMEATSTPIGRVAYIKVKAQEFGIINGSGLSPLAYIGESNGTRDKGAKILAYSRKPGMVIEYVVDDNEWMKGVHVDDGEYVLAFFVPNSDGKLHKRYLHRFKTLENYLRETENADHANWTDIYDGKYQITIVKRIKAEVSKAMATDLGESIDAVSSRRTSTLSRKFGQIFLPKTSFGKAGTPTERPRNVNPNIKRGSRANINIIGFKPKSRDVLKVYTEVFIPKKSQYDLTINVVTTEQFLDQERWKKTFGDSVPYPFEIIDVRLGTQKHISLTRIDNNDYTTIHRLANSSGKGVESMLFLTLKINDPTMFPSITLINKQSLK